MENEIRCVQRASNGICTRDCSKCDLVKEDNPLLEAYGIAVLALEKQIPKVPNDFKILRDFSNRPYCFKAKCPNCTAVILSTEQDYCHCCGQHIDWVNAHE